MNSCTGVKSHDASCFGICYYGNIWFRGWFDYYIKCYYLSVHIWSFMHASTYISEYFAQSPHGSVLFPHSGLILCIRSSVLLMNLCFASRLLTAMLGISNNMAYIKWKTNLLPEAPDYVHVVPHLTPTFHSFLTNFLCHKSTLWETSAN